MDGLAVLVERFDVHGAVPGHYPGQPGNAQASFVEADAIAVIDWPQRGIDQHGERETVAFPGCPLLLGQLTPPLWPVLQHRDLEGHTDLGRGQPYAGRGFHGGPHLGDEQLQLAGAQSGGADRFGRPAQDGMAAFDDRQYAWVAHG
jgi:hypothetical protein